MADLQALRSGRLVLASTPAASPLAGEPLRVKANAAVPEKRSGLLLCMVAVA
jgi:hypothetical protein